MTVREDPGAFLDWLKDQLRHLDGCGLNRLYVLLVQEYWRREQQDAPAPSSRES